MRGPAVRQGLIKGRDVHQANAWHVLFDGTLATVVVDLLPELRLQTDDQIPNTAIAPLRGQWKTEHASDLASRPWTCDCAGSAS